MRPHSLDRFRVVVAVCAHPDDEAFGLGAIITTLVDAGTEVRLVCLTRGEMSALGASGDLADRRLQELRCSADILGIDALAVHDHSDGGLTQVGAQAPEPSHLRPLR
jgi:N-acetylglucosamine malate deacetylase 2